jgi:enoyl-CoA hydratase
VSHDELLGFSRGLAADAASADPGALRAILATYREGTLVTGREARQVEARAHRSFHARSIDSELVASRREAVIERGRAQRG